MEEYCVYINGVVYDTYETEEEALIMCVMLETPSHRVWMSKVKTPKQITEERSLLFYLS